MAQIVITLCLSTAMSFGVDSRSHAKVLAKDATMVQVHETLQNLLQSIEDEGLHAEKIFGAKQKWCSSSIKTESASRKMMADSIEQLQSDLKEHEAAVDEATGSIHQIQAEMVLTEHIINQTQQVLQSKQAELTADSSDFKSFLQLRGIRTNTTDHSKFKKDEAYLLKMLANKKQRLGSMQGELEAEYPVLAQVQDLAAQTKQRITDRSETVEASRKFASIAQEECQKSSNRAEVQGAARAAVTDSIQVTLQALEAAGISSALPKKIDAALSFAQLSTGYSQITASDVLGLNPRSRGHRKSEMLSQVGQRHSSSTLAADAKPNVKALMASLTSDRSTDQEHAAWCTQEHDRNLLQLNLKQDAVDQLNTEIAAHADVEAELSDELESMDSGISFFQKTLKDAQVLGSNEKAYTKNSEKDHKLAVRITDQALAILADYESRTSSEGGNPVVAKSVGSALSALRLARARLAAQATALTGFLSDVQVSPERVSQAVTDVLNAQQQEHVNIELAKDNHIKKRTECQENLRIHAAELKEAQAFMQQLKEECNSKVYDEEEHRRKEQMQALQDVQKTLDGQDLPPPPDSEAFGTDDGEEQDSSEAVKAPVKILTPMERAAQEMGVSED